MGVSEKSKQSLISKQDNASESARSEMYEGGSGEPQSQGNNGRPPKVSKDKTVTFESEVKQQTGENKSGEGEPVKDGSEVQAVNQGSSATSIAKNPTSMDVMRSAVINLSQRVHKIEQKVTKVEKLIQNHNSSIRTQVLVEKEKWM